MDLFFVCFIKTKAVKWFKRLNPPVFEFEVQWY